MTNPIPKDPSKITAEEFEALLDQVAPLPGTPGAAAGQTPKQTYTPEQLEALNKAFLESVASAPTTGTPAPQSTMTPAEFDALFNDPATATAQPFNPQAFIPQAEPHGPMHPAASDIATGIGELPGAIASGARNAAQESLKFAVDAGNFVGSGMDRVVSAFGGATGQDIKAPELPAFGTKPKSVTGGLAENISQFLTGLVGLGKLARPIEAAVGLARAGKAAKVGTEVAKAATVGAVAFDPYGPRLSDMVESVPRLSNPVSRYLRSDPFDTAAEGRLKNAMESIALDAALVGGMMASIKLFRAARDLNAGTITPKQYDAVVAEAETLAQPPKAVETPAPEAAPARDILQLDPQMPAPVQRDVLALGSPTPATSRDMLDLAGKPYAGLEPRALSPSGSVATATSEQTTSILRSLEADADALARYGSRREAIDAGHEFGTGAKVPWQKLALEDGPAGVAGR